MKNTLSVFKDKVSEKDSVNHAGAASGKIKHSVIRALLTLILASGITAAAFADPYIHSATGSLPAGNPVTIDDFEDGNYWIYASDDWDQFGGHKWSIGADLSKKWKSNGKYSLDCLMEKSTNPNETQAGVWYTEGEYDLSEFNYIVMDVYIPDPNVYFGLMLAVQTKSWEWIQAPEYHWLQQGVHTLVYDISGFDPDAKKNVYRFMIMHAMDGSQEGHFYVDNIRGYK